mgnify:CR=1 FL=1
MDLISAIDLLSATSRNLAITLLIYRSETSPSVRIGSTVYSVICVFNSSLSDFSSNDSVVKPSVESINLRS